VELEFLPWLTQQAVSLLEQEAVAHAVVQRLIADAVAAQVGWGSCSERVAKAAWCGDAVSGSGTQPSCRIAHPLCCIPGVQEEAAQAAAALAKAEAAAVTAAAARQAAAEAAAAAAQQEEMQGKATLILTQLQPPVRAATSGLGSCHTHSA
jgi:hypothetical protein